MATVAKTIRFAFDMVIFIAADSCYYGGDGNRKDDEESASVRSWQLDLVSKKLQN